MTTSLRPLVINFISFVFLCHIRLSFANRATIPQVDYHFRSISHHMSNRNPGFPAIVNDPHSPFVPSNHIFQSSASINAQNSSLRQLPPLPSRFPPSRVIPTLPSLPRRPEDIELPKIVTTTPNPEVKSTKQEETTKITSTMETTSTSTTSAVEKEKQPVCECPVQYIESCCAGSMKTQLKAWFRNYTVPDSIKTAVSRGEYGQLTPEEFSQVPLFILRSLREPAIKWITVSQTAYYLSKNPTEIMATVNLLRKIRQDHFNVLLSNLRTAVERGHKLFSNISHAVHGTVAWAARHQWGPYETWNNTHVSTISFWLPYIPCDAFYDFQDDLFISAILPGAVARQNQLSECAKTALFIRMYQSGQLLDMKTWAVQRTITFAQLLTGAPPRLLATLPASTTGDVDVLRTLTELDFDRSQSEALLSSLTSTKLSTDQILAMEGLDGNGKLLRYLPSTMMISNIEPQVYQNDSVNAAFREAFCHIDSKVDYRSGYQSFWWYRGVGSPRDWKRKDMENVGCLVRYFAPVDLARLDLFEMAKNIEATYTTAFDGGDYSQTQARILFNYGSQLLHLGTSSWTAQRFMSVPAAIVPGMPIRRVSAFSPEEIIKKELIGRFKQAADTNLGLNTGQIAVAMQIISVSNGGIREAVRDGALDQSTPLISFISFPEMSTWELTDFRASKPPKLTAPQSNYWLKVLLGNQQPITLERLKGTLFPFIHGLDCHLITRIQNDELVEILAVIDGITGHEIEPAIARCLKDRFTEYIESMHHQEHDIVMPADDTYWPSLIVTVGRSISQQFNGLELRRMSDLTCRTVVSTATDVGKPRKFQMLMRPRGRRESFVRAALACLNRDPLSDFKVGLSDALVLKYALSDLPGDIYYRIPDEVLFKNLHFFQGGCPSANQRRGLMQKLLSAMGPTDRWTREDVTSLGCLVYHLETVDTDKIPDSAFYGRIQVLDRCFGQQYSEAAQFLTQCAQELAEEDYSALDSRIKHMNRRLSLLARHSVQVELPALAAAAPDTTRLYRPMPQKYIKTTPRRIDPSPNRRFQGLPSGNDWQTLSGTLNKLRKTRSSNPAPYGYPYFRAPTIGSSPLNLTCDWVKAAGGHIVSLPKETFTDGQNLNSAEFVRCIPEFGKYPHWPRRTRNALWERVKTEIGYPNSLELEMMGHLLLSLSVSEINKLDFGGGPGLDLLHSFGSLSQWKEDQLLALAARFKSSMTSFLGDLDTVYFAVMGTVLCGFSQTELVHIRPEVYVQVSVPIGQLKSCTPWALKALAKLAQSPKAFGPAKLWARDSVETVGIVAAGLDITDLERLHLASLAGLTCEAAFSLSASQFQSFSPEQIKHFSMNSAMCIRSQQVHLLSQAQRFAVWEAGSEAMARTSNAIHHLYANLSMLLFTYGLLLFITMEWGHFV